MRGSIASSAPTKRRLSFRNIRLNGLLALRTPGFHRSHEADAERVRLTPGDFTTNPYAVQLDVPPLTRAEVASYYKRDAFIWRVFLAFRKLDRFVKTKVLRRRYRFILPGKINR